MAAAADPPLADRRRDGDAPGPDRRPAVGAVDVEAEVEEVEEADADGFGERVRCDGRPPGESRRRGRATGEVTARSSRSDADSVVVYLRSEPAVEAAAPIAPRRFESCRFGAGRADRRLEGM